MPSTTTDPGGTAVETRGPLPIGAIAIALAGVLAVVLVFALRGRGGSSAAPAPASPAPQVGTEVAAPAPQAPAATAPPATTNIAPSAGAIANDLERQLKRKRLWSTVEVIGDHADVRSSSCGDPAMTPLLDASRAAFKAAGLTRLRCLEQSGRVVVERTL